MVAFVFGTPKTDFKKGKAIMGYFLYAKSGDNNHVYYCGEEIIVTVANSTDEITTGTEVWSNPSMTVHYPDGIITSRSGSTNGLSFFVANSIIGFSASPC